MNFKEVNLINNFLSIESGWQDFINLINKFISYEVKEFDKFSSKNYSRTGLVRFYDQLTLAVDSLELTSYHFSNERNKIKKFVSDNKRIVTYETSIISFTNNEKTTGKHFDAKDVLYAQFIGSVIWKVWATTDKEDAYVLSPGDLIFVPKNIYHEVKSITPRAGISFTVE